MAKPSEDTLTTIFKEFLAEKGVKVEAFPIWRTPVGIRKPDLLCKNSKFYPLEAKIKEKDLVKDIIKVQNDYMKHAKTLNIGGSFILKHPNPQKLKLDLDENQLKRKLRKAKFLLILIFPQDDPRQFERIKGSVDELISIIVDTINYKRIKKELQPDVVIEILRNTTKYLNDVLKNVKMEILLDTLGGFEFFKDILDIDVKKQYSSITVAISFFILTQLLFYHIVAKYRPKKLKPLNEIKKIDELNEEYFSKVLDINYRVIFGIDVISHLPNTAVDHINKIILTLKSIRPENIRSDLLGSIFHDLIPLNVRKRVAAYYTNILAAELLAHLTIDNYDNMVLDLACGSGGLLVASYNRKRQLLERKKEFTQEDHNKFIKEDLFGIDIMPFSVNIASCNVSLQSPEYITNRVNIGLWDSIDLQPGDIIPEFATLKFSFRTKTMDSWIINEKTRRITELEAESKNEKEFLLKKCDIILMNPPFTRQERLPIPYKEKLKIRFKQYKNTYNDAMGLHGVFILLGDIFLSNEGRMGLVLPASFLARKSFQNLRKFLCRNYCIDLIVYNTSRLNYSESTTWREILLIIKKTKPQNHITKICRLTKFPISIEDAISIAESIKNNKKSNKYKISKIKQDELELIDDWSLITIFSPLFHKVYSHIKENSIMIPLNPNYNCYECDLRHFKTELGLNCFIQHVSRAGTNQMKEDWLGTKLDKTSLSIKHIVIHNTDLKIPRSKIGMGLRTTSNLRVINVDDVLGYLLIAPFKDFKNNFLRYIFDENKIQKFKANEFNKILKNYESRKSYLHLNRRLYLSAPGTSYVAFYSNNPFVSVDTWGFYEMNPQEAKLITLWLNSTFGIIQLLMVGVAIEGNWMKIHKYMLERFYIPDPEKFLKKNQTEIEELFSIVSKVEVPSLVEQLKSVNEIRKTVDNFFIEKLDLEIWKDYNGINNFLDLIQKELIGELRELCPSDF